MASEDEALSTEQRVRRSVTRSLANATVLLIAIALLAGWAALGFYQLEPGQAAVVLRLGRYARTVAEPGLRWHLPPPLERREVVNVSEIEQENFGFRGGEEEPNEQELLEASMQTSDNNIVRLSFIVNYLVKDAFESRFRLASSRETLRDAAQAAIREVVGRITIDGVLSEKRGAVELETERILQEILDFYEAGLAIQGVELQEVQPPAQVKASFDDVIAAGQDASRKVNEAQGYQNELLPRARAEAAELIASANGYKEAKIAQATGEATRFRAIAAEYRRAPEVTQKRLYLETMESVLPTVDKVIIEPGTTSILPYLPIGRNDRGAEK